MTFHSILFEIIRGYEIMKLKTRTGNILIHFLVAFVIVSLTTSFLVSYIANAVQRLGTLSMKNQAYFLADEVTRATILTLTKEKEDGSEILLNTMPYPQTDVYNHEVGSEYLGKSTITLTKEQYPYYDEMKDWIVVTVEVEIPDKRINAVGDKKYTYLTVSRILVENPNVQLLYLK